MNYWVRHHCLVFGLCLTLFKILFCILLKPKGILTTVLNTLSAYTETFIYFLQRLCVIIEAMHAAPCALVVHDIELLIQKCIEYKLSLSHSFLRLFNHILLHIIYNILILGYLEKLHNFVMAFQFLV